LGRGAFFLFFQKKKKEEGWGEEDMCVLFFSFDEIEEIERRKEKQWCKVFQQWRFESLAVPNHVATFMGV